MRRQEAAAAAERSAALQKLRLPANFDSLPPQELALLAAREKTKGNESFQGKDYEAAAACYSRSLAADASSATAALVLSNRAQARLFLKQWEGAEADADAALAIDRGSLKALKRRAAARLKRGKYALAAEDCRQLQGASQEASVRAEAGKMLQEALEGMRRSGEGGGAAPRPAAAAAVAAAATAAGAAAAAVPSRRVVIEEVEEEEEEEEGGGLLLLLCLWLLPSQRAPS